ncbi:MAG: 30S ribosomal protein S8 [Deltaproteobacteria bacterium]|nr:MAG: 30S ribosomal protein S8 [Deltaproteobacteria bacterium]
MTDPIADLLTRIRNAGMARHAVLRLPSSRLKTEIARVLKEEGYIEDYGHEDGVGPGILRIVLRYHNGQHVITRIKRESRPGQRRYVAADSIPKVMNGFGIAVLTTSRGVMTGHQATEQGVGGELLASVY